MKITSLDNIYSFTVGKDLLKQCVGDGPEFEILYDALLNQIKKTSPIHEENGQVIEYKPSSTNIGGNLNDMPIRYRGEAEKVTKLEPLNVSKLIKPIENNNSGYTNSIANLTNITEDEKMKRIYSAVDKYSKEYNIDPKLILSIIKTESNFNPNAKSSAGAMGLMQLMDFNCETYGVKNPYDIEENIRGGVAHIKEYIDMFDGNLEMGLMAYNGGPGNMSRRGVKSSEDLYKMPKETQNYVPKVLKYYNEYKNMSNI